MFKENDRSGASETIIGPSVKVEGNFSGEGDIIVEGQVAGTLATKRDLRIGESAKIRAEVTAGNIVMAGEIRGNVTVAERLELSATAKIFGNVEAKVIAVAAGATLNGKVTMRGNGELGPTEEISRELKKK